MDGSIYWKLKFLWGTRFKELGFPKEPGFPSRIRKELGWLLAPRKGFFGRGWPRKGSWL